MQQPDFNLFLEVKEVQEDGSFVGIASVYDVEDLGGDIIEKGAFKKTISEHPVVPILWQHDSSEVIGSGEVKEQGNKIMLTARLDLEDDVAKKAYRKLKQKLIKGLSIGFQTIKAKFEELEEEGRTKYIRRIQELKLWEVSVVTFPMLPAAQVMNVKHTEDLEGRIRELEAKIQALQAPPQAEGTPEPEPPKVEEPPVVVPTEPKVDHSLAQSFLNTLKGE